MQRVPACGHRCPPTRVPPKRTSNRTNSASCKESEEVLHSEKCRSMGRLLRRSECHIKAPRHLQEFSHRERMAEKPEITPCARGKRGGATDAESAPKISAIREFCTQRGAAERLRDAAVSSQMTTATRVEGLAQNPAPRGRKHKPP